MLTRAVKQTLSEEVALWLGDGVISEQTAAILRTRYQAERFGLGAVVKYIGVCGGVFCFFGLLGFIGYGLGGASFGGPLTIASGAAVLAAGIWLARDLRNRYAFSGRAVTAVGAMTFAAGIAVTCKALDVSDEATAVFTGACALPLFVFLAYRLKDGFLLLLATLGFFHWVGSCESMWGASTYEFEVDQPVTMSLVSVAIFALGAWHARHRQRFLRFDLVYQSVALVYFNLSLLILSIVGNSHTPLWIAVFSAAALAQIVLGARLQSALLIGFGVTAAALDLFTRYFETFWSRLSLGAFLALGGAVLLGAGLLLERAFRPRGGAA